MGKIKSPVALGIFSPASSGVRAHAKHPFAGTQETHLGTAGATVGLAQCPTSVLLGVSVCATGWAKGLNASPSAVSTGGQVCEESNTPRSGTVHYECRSDNAVVRHCPSAAFRCLFTALP